MNEVVSFIAKNQAQLIIILLSILAVLAILMLLTYVKKLEDPEVVKAKRDKEFHENVKMLDQHHGHIEYRRSIRNLIPPPPPAPDDAPGWNDLNRH